MFGLYRFLQILISSAENFSSIFSHDDGEGFIDK